MLNEALLEFLYKEVHLHAFVTSPPPFKTVLVVSIEHSVPRITSQPSLGPS